MFNNTEAASPASVSEFVNKKNQCNNIVATYGVTNTLNIFSSNRLINITCVLNRLEVFKCYVDLSFSIPGVTLLLLLADRSILWYLSGIILNNFEYLLPVSFSISYVVLLPKSALVLPIEAVGLEFLYVSSDSLPEDIINPTG